MAVIRRPGHDPEIMIKICRIVTLICDHTPAAA
jgi:hypothetical protein